jgi:two-component system, chemotaxis family, chemotaxis protein CheY
MWKILVVDDDATNRKLLREILHDMAACDLIESGPKAIEAFRSAFQLAIPYDLVLLDIAMPEMDGIEVLKQLRMVEKLQGIEIGHGTPIFMITAHKQEFMKAFREGADDYLLKPIDPAVLIDKVQDRLARPPRMV